MDFQPILPHQIEELKAVAAEYRAMWNSLVDPPYPCDFSGTKTDLDVLDFVDYEAGEHPREERGAALIWGNVFAQTGIFEWVTDGKELLLQSKEKVYPCCLICPVARVLEIDNSSSPHDGKYEWLTQETVARCLLQGFSEEEQRTLIGLTTPEPLSGYVHWGRQAMDTIDPPKDGK